MLLNSSTPPKPLVANRNMIPVETELSDVSIASHRRLYKTPSGGIGNFEPESRAQSLQKGPLNPLLPVKVLKLPWKKHKRHPKGNLCISAPLLESTKSDCGNWRKNIEPHSDENQRSIVGQSPEMYNDTASLWNPSTPSEINSPSIALDFSVDAPRLRSYQSLDTFATRTHGTQTRVPATKLPSPLCSPSMNRVSHFSTPSSPSVPSSPRDAPAETTSNCYLWDVSPGTPPTQTRFVEHIGNVKTIPETIMAGESLPPTFRRYSKAKSFDGPGSVKGASILKELPEPTAEAQSLAPAQRTDGVAQSSTVTKVARVADVNKRSKSQGAHAAPSRPSIRSRDEPASDTLRSTLKEAMRSPNNIPNSLSDLVLDRDGFLVVMPRAHRLASAKTSTKSEDDTNTFEDRTLVVSSFPTSPSNFFGLLNSAAVNAAIEARNRRRAQVEVSATGNGSESGYHSTTHSRINSSWSTDSSNNSYNSPSSGGDGHKSSPSDSSSSSSMWSPRSLSLGMDKEEECMSPHERRGSTKPSQAEENADLLDDELEGVKLMIGSIAVCPKSPLQHLQYHQLHPQLHQALLPPLVLTSSPPSGHQRYQKRPPRNSSLGQVSAVCQQEPGRGSRTLPGLITSVEFGAAI
ncbi:hypothetical protein PSTG_10149 [Puccinia striiformis f. sp. tritici PST-78]|uniref:Uncharacterized protein n=1 Tax=Puccinia striiformis f. sp. tritici PST-78 TaxID=1165861 RepID=A0A0L0VBL9_9BASI|nr:hypothetical protein PSTG_10149 [Puccinia striiformis f. sp. tritici PST-78]